MTKYEQRTNKPSFPHRRESIAAMDPRLREDNAVERNILPNCALRT